MALFKIIELDQDGKYPVKFYGLIEAICRTKAREKASVHFKNPEMLSTGFYDVVPFDYDEIEKKKRELRKELRKYEIIK